MTINVLVTGGTGFVGYWLRQTEPPNRKCTYLSQDDYNRGEWKKSRYDVVFHLANIPPTEALRVGNLFVYASSGAVYFRKNEYADNKRKWESEVRNSTSHWIIPRLFSFIGSHLKNLYAVTNFIQDAREGKPITILGDGSSVRSYLHGEDLGRILWMVSNPFSVGTIFDLGGETPYTLLDVAYEVAKIIPSEIRIKNDPSIEEFTYYPPNGFRERISLHDALERTIRDEGK